MPRSPPWLASLLDLLELNPTLIDTTHFGFLITGVCLFLNTARYQLFLIRPEHMARAILDTMSDMVLTLDRSGRIERANLLTSTEPTMPSRSSRTHSVGVQIRKTDLKLQQGN